MRLDSKASNTKISLNEMFKSELQRLKRKDDELNPRSNIFFFFTIYYITRATSSIKLCPQKTTES